MAGVVTTLEPASEAQTRLAVHPEETCEVSVIIPIFNEENNIEPLYQELFDVLEGAELDYEMIFVDDGSSDRSLDKLTEVISGNPRALVVELRRNFGQTAAMSAGIEHSRGRVLVPIDGDLQNDPGSIPALLKTLNGPPSYDIVSGWRRDRKDKTLSRKIPSKIANAMIRKFTGVHIHDFGCTLKAYRREVLRDVSLSSDLHRFLPALANWHGAKITEMEVNHRPRIHGASKYGLWRTVRVLLDLIIVKFMGTYMNKPLYFFGKIGMFSFLASLLVLLVAIGQKFAATSAWLGQPDPVNLNRNVLTTLSALLVFLTAQCIFFGIVCEMLVRVYHVTKGGSIYRVRSTYRGEE